MKKLFAVLVVSALAVSFGAPLLAAVATTTVKGEVIDMTCYAKEGKAATGAAHADCAMTCAKKGLPMGILAGDVVYQIAGSYTKDNNKMLLGFVAKQVTAVGTVTEKDGKKMIDVSSMKAQ
jgi:hypothetical protein